MQATVSAVGPQSATSYDSSAKEESHVLRHLSGFETILDSELCMWEAEGGMKLY